MSKLGKKPIIVSGGVTALIKSRDISVSGPLGELKLTLPGQLTVSLVADRLKVDRLAESKQAKSLHGTYVRLLTNAIKGVSQGFTRVLEVEGTGFKAEVQGDILLLSLGYSHQIKFPIPIGIKIQVTDNKISIIGIDRDRVGLVAHDIKSFRPPDSYKGKGIRHEGQKLKLKPGKAATKGTTK